ncbi:unnamed protein product [Discula destructiva]
MSGLVSDQDGLAAAHQQTNESVTVPQPTRKRTHDSTTKGTADHRERRDTGATVASMTSVDGGSRRKVARAFEVLGDRLGTPAPNGFDDSQFMRGGLQTSPLFRPRSTGTLSSLTDPRIVQSAARLRRQRYA